MKNVCLTITFRPAIDADAEALVRLRIEAMRESLESIGRFDPVRARERFLSTFESQYTRHIDADGERVGFVAVKPMADALQLDHLYIHPQHQDVTSAARFSSRFLQKPTRARKPFALVPYVEAHRIAFISVMDLSRFRKANGIFTTCEHCTRRALRRVYAKFMVWHQPPTPQHVHHAQHPPCADNPADQKYRLWCDMPCCEKTRCR